MKNGIVKRVAGPVVDVQFPAGHLPDIYNAIEIQLEDRKVVMEAMQQLGSDRALCVAVLYRRHCPGLRRCGHRRLGDDARG